MSRAWKEMKGLNKHALVASIGSGITTTKSSKSSTHYLNDTIKDSNEHDKAEMFKFYYHLHFG